MRDYDINLDDILMPDIATDVAEQYRSLASRASQRQFSLIEDDVIVLDTETTGLDFRSCELIEISAARLRGNEIVEEFDEFVRPTTPIPPEIVQLTGITNEMVENAAGPMEVMARFWEFAGDAPLIAHNATFDHHFIKKATGYDCENIWIDTLELSRITLPCLTSYKLADLSRAFGLTPSTHRAIDDVRALCGLWRILLVAASDLPAGLLDYLSNMYSEIPWAYRPIFSQIAAEFPEVPFSLTDIRSNRCSRQDLAPRPDARALEEEGRKLWPETYDVGAEFGPLGIVQNMYDSYEARSEQVTMSRAVADAFANGRHVAIEAGTGVGKSIAYLLPSVILAQRNGITVGIATKSNALTDQLVNHELPLLSSVFPRPVSYVALKGYDNYPCLRKVERLARIGQRRPGSDSDDWSADGGRKMPSGLPKPSEDLLNAIAAILAFAAQSAQGDLNSLGIRWGKVLRSDLTCSVGECQKRRCPFFPNRCFLHGARRRAAAADIVVTNHSLLFRNVGSDIDVLPPIRYWVVDEAHSVESEARRQWAKRVNSHDVTAGFELLGTGSSGALGGLAKEARSLSGAAVMLGSISKTSAEASRALVTATAFFDEVRRMLNRQRKSGYDSDDVWISRELREGQLFAPVLEAGAAFQDRLSEVVKHALETIKSMADEASTGRNQALTDRLDELTKATQALRETLDALNLILDGSDERYVYSAGVDRRIGTETYELLAEPLDIGSELANRWYPEMSSVVFSSATIAVGDEFDHFNHEVGLDNLAPSSYQTMRLDSSYDFEKNMNVLVASGMAEPNAQGYLEDLERLLVNVHVAMGGSVLTLFTNRHDMEQMFELVEPVLARRGQLLLCQQRGGNVRMLRDRFIAEPSSSLFALRSFWEGFDAAGDTLRCVVIPKLPFQRPTEPVAKERDLREKNAWSKYSLPEAVLTMKQAAGRLIRSSTDRGCLVLADARLLTKGYGKVFLRALPKKQYQAVPKEQIGDALREWVEEHEAR